MASYRRFIQSPILLSDALDASGCRFVTRLKKNSPATLIETRAVEPDGAVLIDRVASLSKRLASSRRNPFDKPVRLVTVRIDSGKEITLVSNDLDAPAADIAALYKQRWQVELFFKWIKQNLKIRHFLGASENAVRIQIVTALIAYLLLRLAQIGTGLGLQAIARLVAKTTFQRRALAELFEPPPDNPQTHDQLQIPFAKI